MSTNNNEAKPKAVRRSSLKNRNLTPKFSLEALKTKQKRSSISWGQVNAFKFKEFNNPTLEETKTISQEEKDEKHKKFLETRRRSIQNEFVPSKMMKDKSKELAEEILSEELRKNMENNIKVGKDAKKEAESNSSSKSNSDSEKDAIKENTSNESRSSSKSKSKSSSRSKSKSSSRRKSSSESKSPSRSSSKSRSSSESESEKKKKKKGKSLKSSRKKEKKEEKPIRKKVKIKISEDKDKDKDKKSKKDRDKDKDNKKKEHKKEKKSKSKEKKVGIKDDKKEEKKVEIKVEKKDEIKDDSKNEIKEQEKRSISENSNVERGIDRNVRLISYKQARELDLDKVAYIALTDGSILIVRKEFGSNNQDIVSKNFDIPKMENTVNNKTYLIERSNLINDNEQNYNYIESEINPKYNNPNFNTVILQREQILPNNYQKEGYNFNNQIYSTTSRPKQNIVLTRNNQITNNNKYSAASNTIWKTNKNPPLFKYFSPYKAPTSQYLNQNQTLRQNYVIQSNNLKEKRIIQIKRPSRPIAQNKYKVVETIPFAYTDNYNNQIIGNQVNDKYIESTFYPETMNYETVVSQNEHYLHRQPNYIYSPLKKIYRKTDAFSTFEQDLNE